jgi:hypothetical protein
MFEFWGKQSWCSEFMSLWCPHLSNEYVFCSVMYVETREFGALPIQACLMFLMLDLFNVYYRLFIGTGGPNTSLIFLCLQ